MLTWLTTSALGFASKVKLWGIIGIGAVVALLSFSAMLLGTGRRLERLHELEQTLHTSQKEAKARAETDALTADAAAKRLRDKWSRR